MQSVAQRLAREVALAELGGKQPFWTGLDEIPQQIIAGYMDVVSLCRTDSAMTGVEERKAWQRAGSICIECEQYVRCHSRCQLDS